MSTEKRADAPGVSYLKALWEDDAGLTWVALGTIHTRVVDGNSSRTESSRVEVLDVKLGRVVANVELPDHFVSGFSDGTVVFSEA